MSFVQYKDAIRCNFNITLVNNSNIESNYSDNKHIRLEKENISYYSMYRTCLITVNGYFHLTDTDNTNGLMVMNATDSLHKSKQNQIGIHSFADIGELIVKPITKDMIYEDVYGVIKLKLSDNLENKTLLLSLGGYLTLQNNSNFYPVGDNIFRLDFNNLDILNKFYESEKYLDLNSLELSTSNNNEDQILLSNLLSLDVLTKYLTLSQSFIIILDTPAININKLHVRKTGLPGMYMSYINPLYPLVTNLGRFPEYWSIKEGNYYSLIVYDNKIENRLFDTISKEYVSSVDNTRLPNFPSYDSDAYFLKIEKK